MFSAALAAETRDLSLTAKTRKCDRRAKARKKPHNMVAFCGPKENFIFVEGYKSLCVPHADAFRRVSVCDKIALSLCAGER